MKLTIDASRLVRKIKKAEAIKAADFEAETRKHLSDSLATATQLTPKRSAGTVTANQRKQYDIRINYIPTVHRLENPSLYVKEGVHWLYVDGKWYNASAWKLTGKALGAYTRLIAERNRRMRIAKAAFVAERRQARFLFARAWLEVGESVGVPVRATGDVKSAHTRRTRSQERNGYRRKYAKNYAIRRGGKEVLSYSVNVGLLATPSRYKTFSHQQIWRSSTARHQPRFLTAVHNRASKLMNAAFR